MARVPARSILVILVILFPVIHCLSFSSEIGVKSGLVTTIVTSSEPLTPSQEMTLDSLGTITSSTGRVAVIKIPSDKLEEARRLAFISGVFAPARFRPLLDVSAPEIGAAFVWQNVSDARGRPVDGSGVVIGVIDTGVDLSHPDLRFPNGTSKVLYLWDQTVSENRPQGLPYGLECSWHQISSGECPEKDTFGHGTHVASIAVSSGLATGEYRGIAPGASLIVVKSGHSLCDGGSWTFDESAIIDGLQYLVDRAQILKMKLVVILSLGGNIGGHDDTSPLEIVIDDLYSQGVIVTVAAGNDADSQVHATGLLGPSNSTRVSWEPNEKATNAILDLWYPSNRTVTATLVTPSGESVTGPTPSNGTYTSDGSVAMTSAKSIKGQELAVSVQAQDGVKTAGWSVILNVADGGPLLRWDAWVDSDSCSYPAASFLSGNGYKIDRNGTVSVPATSTGAIAVGAYVTKNSWVNKEGKVVKVDNYHLGDIAAFSSRGPTRDGRTKPDMSAPGTFIAAARSADVLPSDNDPDQYHRVLAGTSMAAPHVAGVVALMLQYDPQLTPSEVRSILTEGTNLDEFTGFIDPSQGSDEWGWGKADARASTALFRVSSIVESLPPIFAVSVSIDAEPGVILQGEQVLTLRFPSGRAHTFHVDRQDFVANSTRYLIDEDDATFSSNAIFTPKVHVQYSLALISPLGQVEGGGWYDAGTYARFAVSPLATSGGLIQLLGMTFFFDHWIDENGNQVSSGPFLMDSPHSLRATWRARVTDWRPVLLAITMIVLSILVLELERRNEGRLQSVLASESRDIPPDNGLRNTATRHLFRRRQ